jgi:hypothetical protein
MTALLYTPIGALVLMNILQVIMVVDLLLLPTLTFLFVYKLAIWLPLLVNF